MIEQQIEALIFIVLKILLILVPLLISVLFVQLAERKVIGYMQSRIGPNRVGFRGILQPFADALKLLSKEMIIPTAANRYLFILAPVVALMPALIAWSVIPFSKSWVLANVNAGVLFILAATSMGVYGILLGGWASNSKYAFLGAMRSAAQVISYEIAMGFAVVGVIMAAGSMNLQTIVMHQSGGLWHWYWIPLLPLCVCYWIAGVAETNRAPFDVSEGESEIVAGFHVEYSGISFALFFLAEYANMFLVSGIMATFFFGGWLSPFEGMGAVAHIFAWVPGIVWFLLKLGFFMFLFIWMRATFPRYRYDQIMYLGWKMLIPVTIFWVVVVALLVQFHVYWFA